MKINQQRPHTEIHDDRNRKDANQVPIATTRNADTRSTIHEWQERNSEGQVFQNHIAHTRELKSCYTISKDLALHILVTLPLTA